MKYLVLLILFISCGHDCGDNKKIELLYHYDDFVTVKEGFYKNAKGYIIDYWNVDVYDCNIEPKYIVKIQGASRTVVFKQSELRIE